MGLLQLTVRYCSNMVTMGLDVTYVLSTNDLDKEKFDGYRFVRIGKTINGETPFKLCVTK